MIYAAGFDFGTSSARIAVIDDRETLVMQHQVSYPEATEATRPQSWQAALDQLLRQLPAAIGRSLGAIALNGTSATVLLCDDQGTPLTPPLLYNDARGALHCQSLSALAPPGSPALGATSSLVKLLWWRHQLPPATWQRAHCLMHQADWLAFQLHGQLGRSDYHNALKLGYDVGQLRYPDWLSELGVRDRLPQVQPPGTPVAPVTAAVCDRYGLSPRCTVMAGTTDSIAAFLASGARSPGDAVTSLGSTLVIKLLSTLRVDDSLFGIYSHRLGDLWLVGGASNTGGNVLKQFFSDAELALLSDKIDPHRPSGLDYYPLSRPGERFPISDPQLPPRLTPRPTQPEQFLQGLLEGMARIEAQGYQRLQDLGASPLRRVLTAGGGAQNQTWTAIRQQYLPVPIAPAVATQAAVGTARLALAGLP